MSTILFSRTIGPVAIGCVIKEDHGSSLEVTEIAIETGAKITDHAYVKPKKLALEVADVNAAATWNALVRFQATRQPFTMVSGLFVYNNMLIDDMTAGRDSQHSGVFKGTVSLREVQIVETARAASDGKDSGKDGGKKSTKAATPSKDKAGAGSQDRASGPVNRGDVPSSTLGETQNKSLASRLFGSSTPNGSSATP